MKTLLMFLSHYGSLSGYSCKLIGCNQCHQWTASKVKRLNFGLKATTPKVVVLQGSAVSESLREITSWWLYCVWCNNPETYLWFQLDSGHIGLPMNRQPASRTLRPDRDTSHSCEAARGHDKTPLGSSALRGSRQQSNSLRSVGHSCLLCSCRAHRGWRLRQWGSCVWNRLSIARRTHPHIPAGSCRSEPSGPGHRLHAVLTPAARCQGNHVLKGHNPSISKDQDDPPNTQQRSPFRTIHMCADFEKILKSNQIFHFSEKQCVIARAESYCLIMSKKETAEEIWILERVVFSRVSRVLWKKWKKARLDGTKKGGKERRGRERTEDERREV